MHNIDLRTLISSSFLSCQGSKALASGLQGFPFDNDRLSGLWKARLDVTRFRRVDKAFLAFPGREIEDGLGGGIRAFSEGGEIQGISRQDHGYALDEGLLGISTKV